VHEQVHRAAAAAGAAFGLAVHLGHDLRHRHAAGQRVAVLAVGGDNAVVFAENGDHAHGDRLLAVIEMQEPADLLLGVELGAFVLEMADADHALEQLEHMGMRQVGRCRPWS
jgi:GTP cyclohydrolase III